MPDANRSLRRYRSAAPVLATGFTYVWVLLMVAVLGAGLAAAGQVWTMVTQREREKELLFIGEQFRRAIGSYFERTPGPVKRYPQRFEDLIEDRRFPIPQRHLRQRYRDPMTGKADWGIVFAADKTIMGVYSNSRGRPLITVVANTITPGGPGYGAWQFIYTPGSEPVRVQQSAGTSASSAAGAIVISGSDHAAVAPSNSPVQASAAPVPSSAPPGKPDKPNDCVVLRAADLNACVKLAGDPKAFELCRRSSNRRYGTCLQGGSPMPLTTQ